MTATEYIRSISQKDHHPIPVYDSNSFRTFTKVLEGNTDFFLFNNGDTTMRGQIPTLWTIDHFEQNYEEFAKFLSRYADLVYCYKLKSEDKVIRIIYYNV